MQPIQNLNGYEYPWAGGSGKNKLDFSALSTTRCSISGTSDDFILTDTVSGASNGTSFAYYPVTQYAGENIYVAVDSMKRVGVVDAGVVALRLRYKVTSEDSYVQQTIDSFVNDELGSVDALVAVPSPVYVAEIVVYIDSNSATDNTGATCEVKGLRIALESGTTWTPYENICPIYGWSGAKVIHTGKNLLGEIEQGGFNSSGINYPANNRVRAVGFFPVIPGEQYTMSCLADTSATTMMACAFYTTNEYGVSESATTGWAVLPKIFTVPSGVAYGRVVIKMQDDSNFSVNDVHFARVLNGTSSGTVYTEDWSANASITEIGKNKLKNTAASQTINDVAITINDDGSINMDGTASAQATLNINSDLFDDIPAGNYKINGSPSVSGAWFIIGYYLNGAFVSEIVSDMGADTSFTIVNDGTYDEVLCRLRIQNGASLSNVKAYPMIRLASDPNPNFSPYEKVVYGGNINFTTGVLSITKANVVISNDTYIGRNNAQNYYYKTNASGIPVPKADARNVICNRLKTASNFGQPGSILTNANKDIRWVTVNSYNDTASMIADIGQLQVVYELETPITVQLTSQEITTLLGSNNIWVETTADS